MRVEVRGVRHQSLPIGAVAAGPFQEDRFYPHRSPKARRLVLSRGNRTSLGSVLKERHCVARKATLNPASTASRRRQRAKLT